MKRHLPKLLWTLAFVLGLFFMVYGFSFSSEKESADNSSSSDKCSSSSIQTDISIKSISRHLLDFSK